jgi:NTE family protein
MQDTVPAVEPLGLRHILKTIGPAARRAIRREGERVTLKAGRALFQVGDPADCLYILLAGALGVYISGSQGEPRLIAFIRPGETVGEMALLSGTPRSATVRALRDCELLRLNHVSFLRIAEAAPELMVELGRIMARRLRDTNAGRIVNIEPRTVAFLPASRLIDVVMVAERLAGEAARLGFRVLTVKPDPARLSSRWLTRAEALNDHVFLCGSRALPEVNDLCARQADRIVIVAEAGEIDAAPALSRRVRNRASHQLLDLLLLHGPDRDRPTVTMAALEKLPVNRHFHIRLDHESDWQRVARVLTGRALGMVLSGGGARAYAHLGVLRAFRDSDIPIDFIGGTSMGAIVAACVAMGWSLKDSEERIRQSFAEKSPLTDYSLPLVGLVRGVRVEALLEHHFGKARIEDLWLPFFCVSSNLTTARAEVHRVGLLARALRASVSLPGILPPVVTARGLLVDGGVVNNLPVDVMRENNRGPVVAVDVARDLALTPAWLKQQMARPLIQRLLRPPLVSILMRAGTVSGEQQYRTQIQAADIAIAPALGAIDLRDWKAFEIAVEAGYGAARKAIAEHPDLLNPPLVPSPLPEPREPS